MTIRSLLLAGSMLALAAPVAPATAQAQPDRPLILAQQQQPPEGTDKDKPPQKGQQTQQPPVGKDVRQPPGGQPPAARQQPPAGQPPAPPAARQQPPAGQPPAPPAARQQPPAGQPPAPPAARQQPPAGQPPAPPAARQQPPAGQPPAPPAARQQPPGGQPQQTQTQPPTESPRAPAHDEQRRREEPKQRPAQTPPPPGAPPPAQQGQQTPPPGTPSRDQRARPQPGTGQPPAAQGQQPGARTPPPAAQTQPPGQPPPPAAQGQPAPGQPPAPAAQGQPAPGQPPAPAAQGQPAPGQPPVGQFQQGRPLPPPAQAPAQPAVTARGAIAPQPAGADGQPMRRVDDVRRERREERDGNRLVIREPDRVIIQEGGRSIIRHNEASRFLMSGREVAVDRRGGEVTTIVERPDGTRIITVTDDNGRLLRRVRRTTEGREVVIIENNYGPQAATTYFVDLPPPVVRIPRERYIVEAARTRPEIIYETLMAPPVDRIDRRYTLEEVRFSQPLRDRMPRIDLDTIVFEFGSWEIGPDQVNRLAVIADGINRVVSRSPSEVFLIEGHTDAVGSDVDNLSLSDRRAESAAVALTERFQVPAENLTTQGYGEQYLKVPTQAAEVQNRRVTVRRITPLLTGQEQSTGQAR